ncbi:MAG: 4-hydroxy-tetrahydrodipicolinate reductase [Bacteroidales bacterium]|jgi:4-hydroxy-tetrahydrodipicolinate reductase|nr:4-hydroxy-tetrahydrodipicolinate reductase [Bacteroidales bacterium]
MKLNLALIGYGKMGKEIEKMSPAFGQITAIIDQPSDWESNENLLKTADVAIEFSIPAAAFDNCKRCLELGIPVITGTTGWQDQLDELLDFACSRSVSFIHGSNFSIGANLFFTINQYLAKRMNTQEQYEISVMETHHTAKFDKPSGTAVTLTELIIQEINRKDGWILNAADSGKIPIFAHRKEGVTGIHEVSYSSAEDDIVIRHQAKNRQGFVTGALKAAQWLVKNPGVYDFKDIFHLI